MASDNPKKDPFFEKHGWKFLLFVSIIFLLFGIGDIIRGMDADPAIAESVTGVAWEELQASSPTIANTIDLGTRSSGMSIFFLSILSIAIVLFAYRQGERWAWVVLWIWPLWMAAIFLVFFTAQSQPGFPAPPPMLSAIPFFLITIVPLVLGRRKFFPAFEAQAPRTLVSETEC